IKEASLIDLRKISSDAAASSLLGEIGLSWQLKALIVNPRLVNFSKYSLRAASLAKSSSVGQ
ncbi:hypothetical protein NT07LI_2967, partial [Listeria innocua FSL S4-378]